MNWYSPVMSLSSFILFLPLGRPTLEQAFIILFLHQIHYVDFVWKVLKRPEISFLWTARVNDQTREMLPKFKTLPAREGCRTVDIYAVFPNIIEKIHNVLWKMGLIYPDVFYLWDQQICGPSPVCCPQQTLGNIRHFMVPVSNKIIPVPRQPIKRFLRGRIALLHSWRKSEF